MPTNAMRDLILVVGGAGFIGSHMVLALQEAGYTPIVLDNLTTGHRDAVLDATFIQGDVGDAALLEQLFSTYPIKAVMHFGACIEVAESVKNPLKYYQNNVGATLTLLKAMLAHRISYFIFSSTAAVYGEPLFVPIDESHPCHPVNPYGKSKSMVEFILQEMTQAPLHYASLRYFNAAGADPLGRLGERHPHETHLIPLTLAVARGLRPHIAIYGQDYATPDGTCLRDYVHVTDLCQAHLLAMQALFAGQGNLVCNLGAGIGYSVQAVIDAARAVTGLPIRAIVEKKRPGDPAQLVADPSLAMQLLNWRPQYSDLHTMIAHAWQFMLLSSPKE